MSVPEVTQLVWTRELIDSFWDYQTKQPAHYFSYGNSARLTKQLRRYLPPRARVLDYGCGPGFLGERLMAGGHDVLFVDSSRKALKVVEARLRQRPGFLGATHPDDLAQESSSFDAVLATEVLEHLLDDELSTALKYLLASLGEEGLALVTTPNSEKLADNMVFCPASGYEFHRWQHLRSFTPQGLASLLEESGLRPVRVWTDDLTVTVRQPLAYLRVAQHRIRQPHGPRLPHLAVLSRKA